MLSIWTKLPASVLLATTLSLNTFQAGAAELVGFNVASTYSLLGSANEPTAPIPLRILLDSPVSEVTAITFNSSNPTIFDSPPNLIVLPGESSGLVRGSAFSLGSTTLTAQLGANSALSNVTVVSQIPAVPEPSALLMLSAGLALVGGAAKRRSRRKERYGEMLSD